MNNRRLKNQSLQAASSLEGNRNFLFPLDQYFRAVLDGGNSRIFYVHPYYLEKSSNLTDAYFSNGLVQPPTRIGAGSL